MHEHGKSDSPIVPTKSPNKAGQAAAEAVEGRGLAEGNTASKTRPGHSAGQGVSNGLDRVREEQEGTRKHGSPRCCTTSISIVSGRPTWRPTRRLHQGWTG